MVVAPTTTIDIAAATPDATTDTRAPILPPTTFALPSIYATLQRLVVLPLLHQARFTEARLEPPRGQRHARQHAKGRFSAPSDLRSHLTRGPATPRREHTLHRAGVLLHGPPGVGKTLLVQQLAAESRANLVRNLGESAAAVAPPDPTASHPLSVERRGHRAHTSQVVLNGADVAGAAAGERYCRRTNAVAAAPRSPADPLQRHDGRTHVTAPSQRTKPARQIRRGAAAARDVGPTEHPLSGRAGAYARGPGVWDGLCSDRPADGASSQPTPGPGGSRMLRMPCVPVVTKDPERATDSSGSCSRSWMASRPAAVWW